MNPYSIPTLIGSITAFSIGILVLSNNIKSKVNKIFSMFCLSIFGWLFSFTIAYSMKKPSIAHAWSKVGCIMVDFAGPIFYHFVALFLNLRRELKWVYITYFLASVLLLLSVATNLIFLSKPRHYFWGYYPNAGPLHILAISLHSAIMIRTIILFYRFISDKNSVISERRRKQARYIFWGTCVMTFPALTDYLPKYGVEIYPFGWGFILIFCAFIGYAIVKHHLLDINIIFRKTIIYSLLASLITAIFVVMIVMLEKFFQGFTGYRSLLASAFIAFLIALGFNPAKNKIQSFVDLYFFKGTAEDIAQENIRLHQELLHQDRMKAAATLAAKMAHEMKNPLTIIKTFSEFLPERYNDKNFIDTFSRLIESQVKKLNFAIQDLLDFSKLSPPSPKPENLYSIIYEISELLSNDFLKHRIKTKLNLPQDAVILADANQLKQVFLNLFLNSIDAMPQGGELLVSSKIVKTINGLSAYKNIGEATIEVYVQDSGCGISKENIKRVFQPFFTTKPTGTGLGLSVVHDILEQHKAKIRVESEEGKWTRFFITFPLLQCITTLTEGT
ncbi:MAG: hypothetical protein A2987_05535 [Omnitrophica bacterium RIFCSPLOWO2_01_FULL_45_10]|nr:MAG: hypothetical protein A2987_05535 [Omnitrophica bacterium RIFCSPLOWO2_01_FULL_45_10]